MNPRLRAHHNQVAVSPSAAQPQALNYYWSLSSVRNVNRVVTQQNVRRVPVVPGFSLGHAEMELQTKMKPKKQRTQQKKPKAHAPRSTPNSSPERSPTQARSGKCFFVELTIEEETVRVVARRRPDDRVA